MGTSLSVNGVSYNLLKLLGHGKSGYSYLAERDRRKFVLKQIHHEPCTYYTFGNKIEAEQHDYGCLINAGIRIPKMLDIDLANERVLKEYIPGPTIYDLVKEDAVKPEYFHQVRHMARQAQEKGLNIDYFPTNFVVCEETLYYVDYECNTYMEQWNFENWGNLYWWKSPEFLAYVKNHP